MLGVNLIDEVRYYSSVSLLSVGLADTTLYGSSAAASGLAVFSLSQIALGVFDELQ